MAYARVTAAASMAVAVPLALIVPEAPGTESAVLMGWLGVIALAVALVVGVRTAVMVASVAFVIRIAMVSVAIGGVVVPIWAHVALLVTTLELAVVSIEARSSVVRVWPTVFQILTSVAVATAVALVMESAVYTSAPGGLLLRVLSVGAVVILVAWIVNRWAATVGG